MKYYLIPLFFLIFLQYVLSHGAADTEYYDILGVSPDASDEEIKQAFRTLSKKKHPDRGGAQEEFVKLNEAYEVLKDPDTRQLYDSYGKDGVSHQSNQHDNGGIFGIFDHFFGQGRGPNTRSNMQKLQDAAIELMVTLEELYNGAQKTISYKRNVICKHCKGTGAEGGEVTTCSKCHGTGMIMVEQNIMPGFRMQTQSTCPKCHGKGKMYKHECSICHGSGVHPQLTTLDVTVEKGMPDGYEIKYERMAEEKPGYLPGDVIVKLRQQQHPYYIRVNNHIETSVELTLTQALLGFDLNIEHLDKHYVNLKHFDITSHGQKREYKEEGMPLHNTPSEFGNLYITYTIKFPDSINQNQRKALLELFEGESLNGEAKITDT